MAHCVDVEKAFDKFQHPFMIKISYLRLKYLIYSKTENEARMSAFTSSTLLVP